MKERRGYTTNKYTTHAEDKALVIDALAGNQKAYNVLVRKYKPILFTAAKRRLPNKNVEDLEDIVMVVMGNAFVKLNQYDPEKSLLFTWMIACVHNYINSIPAQKKRIQTNSIEDMYDVGGDTDSRVEYEVPDDYDYTESMELERVATLIRLLVDKLPEDSCEVLKLRYFKQLSHREIGEIIDCPEKLVWVRLKTAKSRLKKLAENEKLF